jgi:hypothetical protein
MRDGSTISDLLALINDPPEFASRKISIARGSKQLVFKRADVADLKHEWHTLKHGDLVIFWHDRCWSSLQFDRNRLFASR